MLDGLEQRGRGPGVADAAQPDAAPGPVQQVGVPLIRAENLHEQATPVAGGRLERPRSLGSAQRPGHLADRHAARAQRRRHPGGTHPPVRHAERHQQPGPHGDPGGQRQHQLQRQQPAGDQPGRADQQQRGPGRPAPRPAQPRRRGHRDRRQSRQHGRIGEARAGQPGTLAQPRGRGAARPGQVGDPGHQGRRRREPARHGGQHPEPAVPQRGDQQHQGRRRDHHLDQAGQHLPGLGRGPDPGDRRRSGRSRAGSSTAITTAAASTKAAAISRITSPGCRYRVGARTRPRGRVFGPPAASSIAGESVMGSTPRPWPPCRAALRLGALP